MVVLLEMSSSDSKRTVTGDFISSQGDREEEEVNQPKTIWHPLLGTTTSNSKRIISYDDETSSSFDSERTISDNNIPTSNHGGEEVDQILCEHHVKDGSAQVKPVTYVKSEAHAGKCAESEVDAVKYTKSEVDTVEYGESEVDLSSRYKTQDLIKRKSTKIGRINKDSNVIPKHGNYLQTRRKGVLKYLKVFEVRDHVQSSSASKNHQSCQRKDSMNSKNAI
ncbi:hypothetical protein H6P81_012886 [Aristolochia fimbriata]|uniref:Uncharacterized protein n=1 Tax=Aristolochia fimbriata TaxID=158543 RepID=A0AAV7EDE5_ARIFI|nr:hypothetical protein H6P81_012886 [Aristolochia fimbriata]